MEVTLADSAGFCFGVQRAVDTVYRQIEDHDMPIYTFGPIIHNEEVVDDLQKKGVHVVSNLEELSSLSKGVMVIRSHGVSRRELNLIRDAGFQIVDATCPFVKKIHRIAERESQNGRHVIIIGNDKHPEVEGIKGWVDGSVTVIENEIEAQNFHSLDTKSLCIVSQTTFNYKKFKDLVEILSKKGYDIIVLNTICNATEERQTEAKQLASVSEAMIVVGGKHSSNTQKLFEICQKECENTYYIQTLSDLDLQKLKSVRNVGITAGASTPNNIIQEVLDNVRRI